MPAFARPGREEGRRRAQARAQNPLPIVTPRNFRWGPHDAVVGGWPRRLLWSVTALADVIKFGTDGWRGVVADDFTFANVRRVAQGSAEYLKSRSPDPLAVVGYDCRFASEEFARTVADVFAANGVRTLMFDRPSPTQVASWTVIDRKATGAAVVTVPLQRHQVQDRHRKLSLHGRDRQSRAADQCSRERAGAGPSSVRRHGLDVRPARTLLRADRTHGRPHRGQVCRPSHRA
ncbi:MAG: hypothetical protein E6J40_13455 [Chloroflexi bacterium]|nr:MAG: hypothetical protein E6J40_13455 [Chloroflexota bacterium]